MKHRTQLLSVIGLILIMVASGLAVWFYLSRPVEQEQLVQPKIEQTNSEVIDVTLKTETVVSGLQNPWDIAFLPSGMIIFSERPGTLSRLADGKKIVIEAIGDVRAQGEGGLTGMTLDSDFANNNYLYTCYNSSLGDVRVVRWKLDNEAKTLSDKTPIVTGIPSNPSGRHSGCRVKSARDGALWIGTGDAADSSHPQDQLSLGGKILRVTRDGKAAGDTKTANHDSRIFNYGHRNIQGIALFDTPMNGVYGFSIEHGSDVNDEVNLITPGNFGWDPAPGYDESVPMTDKTKFPDAVEAVWSSGGLTIAPSGGDIITGKNWGQYNGALAMAVLKAQDLRMIRFDTKNNHKLVSEKVLFKGDFGRLRSATLGLDGNLYLTTSNGNNDKIIRVVPVAKKPQN